MFANICMAVMNLAFPDVCDVIAGPAIIPTPFPNIALSATHIPSVFNVIVGGGLAENLLTSGTISDGDEAGLGMGLISGTIIGPDRQMLGSFKVMTGGIFATRLTTLTIQNMINAPIGASLVPSQFVVLYLS